MLIEANVDALVGPTHHFGGLGVGNVASHQHAGTVSRPKQAALEGLRKAAMVAELGVPQFIWLPPVRPRLDWLNLLGFNLHADAPNQSLREELMRVSELAPQCLSAAFSSAFMWAANSGTVSPACDSQDRRCHFTPANLLSSWHRASEALERHADFNSLFGDGQTIKNHEPLPSIMPLRDEGAANHMRLSNGSGEIGFNLFVHGADERLTTNRHGADQRTEPDGQPKPLNSNRGSFFPRHTLAASQAIARRHRLDPNRTFYLHQHPEAIAAGVFHNDVIATSHQNLLIYHELAFWAAEDELGRFEQRFNDENETRLLRIMVTFADLSLEEAVASYFFNSQIVTPVRSNNETQESGRAAQDLPRMVLICPQQCQQMQSTKRLIKRLLEDGEIPIDDVRYVDLTQSMANGGGPACLRLRVPIAEPTLSQLSHAFGLNAQRSDLLASLIDELYPEEITTSDFIDPDFVSHARSIVRALQARFAGPQKIG